MQAEHIPVHLGSMPDAVAAVLDERAPARGRLDPQRPLPRRHAPAGHDADLADLRSRRRWLGSPTRLCGQPRTSRGHRRAHAGRHAGRLGAARGRGGGHPAHARDDEVLEGLAQQMSNPSQRLADLRAQRAANLTGERRLLELLERDGADVLRAGMAEILDYAERRTRARLSGAARRQPRGRGRPGGRRRRPGEGHPPVRERPDRGRPAHARLHGHRRPGGGQPQLPALGDQVGRVLRGAGGDGPGRPAVRGRLPPDRGDRAGGMPAERAVRRPPSWPATSRRRAASPTWCCRALGGATEVPAQGQGTMNNLTFGR